MRDPQSTPPASETAPHPRGRGVAFKKQGPLALDASKTGEFAQSVPVFAYLRVSSPDQANGDGFERQERAIRKYCAKSGMQVRKVWREKVSGTLDSMDRPVWAEMVGALLANGVKTVVIEKLDRLARDLMIQEHIIADVRRRGLTMISAAEPDLCVDDPSRKLMRQIMGAIAEYDKTMIVLKTRAARERIRARGERCEGRKPYGEFPGEAEVLAEIRRMSSTIPVKNPTGIAEELNQLGLKTRSGKPWHPFTVARILKRVWNASGV